MAQLKLITEKGFKPEDFEVKQNQQTREWLIKPIIPKAVEFMSEYFLSNDEGFYPFGTYPFGTVNLDCTNKLNN